MKRNNNPNIKIIVACHKADPNIMEDDMYMPIHVGKALHPGLDLGFQGDNTGDNISEKNETYCELTAIYWAWKNLKDVDIIGLCHYRRYFNFYKKLYIKQEEQEFSSKEFKSLTKELLPPLNWENKEALLPVSRPHPDSILNMHIKNLDYIDFCLLEKIILDKYPDYRESIWKIWYKTQNVPQRNMFLMKWDIFDKYCKFLFDILSEVEKHAKLSSYKYYSRLYGFMGELLLPLFLYHNNYKIEQRQIIFISNKPKKESIFTVITRSIFYKIRFTLNTISVKQLYSKWKENILRNEFPQLYK